MGKKPVSVLKANGYSIYPYILRKSFADENGLRGINIKATKVGSPEHNFELYDQKLVRIKGTKFENGNITSGHSREVMEELNLRIQSLKITIADYFRTHPHIIKDELMIHLYGNSFKKKTNNQYVTIPVTDRGMVIGEEVLTTSEIKELMSDLPKDLSKVVVEGTGSEETGEMVFQSREDVEEEILSRKYQRSANQRNLERRRELDGMTPELRYMEEDGWDKTNIFHLFGYLRFVIKKDAAGNPKLLISYDAQQLMSNLLSYRANRKPSEHVKDFNADWIHGFYKFVKETGNNLTLKKASHNPFVIDAKYKFTDKTKFKPYSLNTFGDSIHKKTLAYIKTLVDEEFITKDFTSKIDAQAFVKTDSNKKGHLTNYNENVDFIEPSEFLSLMYADLSFKKYGKQIIQTELREVKRIDKKILDNLAQREKNRLLEKRATEILNDLEETRDSFVLAVLLGGLRVSDLLNYDKTVVNLTSFSLIQFEQIKTGGYVKNVIVKPALALLRKHHNKIPVESEAIFARNLKKLFKLLDFDRVINWKELTMQGAINHSQKLFDAISSKFARSTYYVLCGAMGESLDTVIKRTGHSDRAIALKHYFAIGAHYTEKDLIKLFEIFNKRRP
ncbi:hypothetical protein WSM22_03660 [Cytophagales bacterium WSM2-2]|nr:hypothetical protein WSM22_03660 [Cytophagales bacterium WSM2-2]